MIDWLSVLFNIIWILGAALATAVFGITYYQVRSGRERVTQILKAPGFAYVLNMAGILFCLGMALTSDRWWEISLWVLLVFGFGYESYSTYISKNERNNG